MRATAGVLQHVIAGLQSRVGPLTLVPQLTGNRDGNITAHMELMRGSGKVNVQPIMNGLNLP